MTRHINAAGLALIKQFEGCELNPYKCPAGVWTVGYGSTGPHVKPGITISHAEAEQLLLQDLTRFEKGVASAAREPTDNQFAAMVSLAFNIGLANFLRSSVIREHNEGDKSAAASAFHLWNKARVHGVLKKLPGLARRRAEEAKLYLRP
jgi:lysozyme